MSARSACRDLLLIRREILDTRSRTSGRAAGGRTGSRRARRQPQEYCDDYADMCDCTCLVCGLLAACGQPNGNPGPPPSPTRRAAEADTHMEEANTVEVDEGMLRDLRITTSAVESRPGGEQVMLLGELAVDQRTYAEVGTPVAARVTRCWPARATPCARVRRCWS